MYLSIQSNVIAAIFAKTAEVPKFEKYVQNSFGISVPNMTAVGINITQLIAVTISKHAIVVRIIAFGTWRREYFHMTVIKELLLKIIHIVTVMIIPMYM